MRNSNGNDQRREVLEFDHGVRVYPPTRSGAYWRVRWDEARRHRDTTALTQTDGIAKATEIVERLSCGMATDLGKATGAALVAHYLDPDRRPPRVDRWSDRHRDEQARYCDRVILPIIGDVPCRQLTRVDFRAVIDQATKRSVAQHVQRCLAGLVAAGIEEGSDDSKIYRARPPAGPDQSVVTTKAAIFFRATCALLTVVLLIVSLLLA